MPLGSGKTYREEVSLAAFFYKTWAYQINRPTPSGGTQPTSPFQPAENRRSDTTVSTTSTTAWIHVPLLIGSELIWYPDRDNLPAIPPGWIKITFVTFFMLVVLWILYRRLRSVFYRNTPTNKGVQKTYGRSDTGFSERKNFKQKSISSLFSGIKLNLSFPVGFTSPQKYKKIKNCD